MSVQKIFVVGGGFMGSGIAQTAITAGYEVRINDISQELVDRSIAGIEKMLTKNVTKGKMTEEAKQAAMARLSGAADLSAAADADLVIEEVAERVDVKKGVFAKLSKICRPDALLASNTSSISIADLSSVVQNPERFLGMHFFSPVPLMKLLEIVKGIATAPETVEAARAVGEKLGKVCIVAKDRPAFIVNRMLDRSADEAYVDRHADELEQFTDVPDTHWAYYEVAEATNAHDYDRTSGSEDWTQLW